MARINLMPWREKRRKKRQQEFVALLGLAAGLAVAVLVAAWLFRAGQIDHQEARNARLSKEIDLMKEKAAQIQDLDIKRDRLMGRKQVIEELQSNRSTMVHLLDQLVRTVPEGIQLVAVVQKGSSLTVEGRAESNARVSEYLRRLEASPWLDKPDLKVIEEQLPATRRDKDAGPAPLPYLFRLNVLLVNPNAPKLDANGDPIPEAADPAAASPAAGEPGAAQAAEPAESGETGEAGETAPPAPDLGGEAPATAPPVDPGTPAATAADLVPGKATLDKVRAMDEAARKAQSVPPAPDAPSTAAPPGGQEN